MDQEQYGCGSCSAKKYGRRPAGSASSADMDSMVDKYAILRDILARKGIKDPTKERTVSKKYGAKKRRSVARKAAAPRRKPATKRRSVARKAPKRRYGCGRN